MPGRSVVEEILAFARSAQRHARGGRQVAALALVRAAPRLGGRPAGAQRLGPRRRGGAVGRRGRRRPARPTGCSARRGRHRPLPRGRADDGGRDGAWAWRSTPSIELPNISLVFVVPVLVAAARHGLVPSLWVSALSCCASTSSSCRRSTNSPSPIPPTSWRCSSSCSWRSRRARSAARTRSQTEAARREARTTAELYAFSRKIAGVIDLYDLLWIVVTHLARLLNAEVVDPDAGEDPATAGWSRAPPFRPTASSATPTSRRRAGRGMPTSRPAGAPTRCRAARWLFMPIRTSRSSIGVIGVLPLKAGRELGAAGAPAARGGRQPGRRRHRAA